MTCYPSRAIVCFVITLEDEDSEGEAEGTVEAAVAAVPDEDEDDDEDDDSDDDDDDVGLDYLSKQDLVSLQVFAFFTFQSQGCSHAVHYLSSFLSMLVWVMLTVQL